MFDLSSYNCDKKLSNSFEVFCCKHVFPFSLFCFPFARKQGRVAKGGEQPQKNQYMNHMKSISKLF